MKKGGTGYKRKKKNVEGNKREAKERIGEEI